jgi:hypothetical protein
MSRKEPKNEQAICRGLMRLIGERRGESVTPTDQPDVNERNKAAVEWHFETATAQFAIEHTRIESFQNQIADGKQFALMLEPLERELEGGLPGFYFLTVGVGEAKAPVSRHAAIRAAIAGWILTHCETLKENEGIRGTPEGVPFEVALSRDVGHGSGLLIFQGLNNNIAELRRDRIREALSRKCPKLHVEHQAGRVSVLALESDDMPFMQHTTIAKAVVVALASRNDSPELVYWVRTTTRPWVTWLLKEGDVLHPKVPKDGPFEIPRLD